MELSLCRRGLIVFLIHRWVYEVVCRCDVDGASRTEQQINSDSSARLNVLRLVRGVNEAAVVLIRRGNVSEADRERSQQPR